MTAEIHDATEMLLRRPCAVLELELSKAASILLDPGAMESIARAAGGMDPGRTRELLLARAHAEAIKGRRVEARSVRGPAGVGVELTSNDIANVSASARCIQRLRRYAGASSAARVVRDRAWRACFGHGLHEAHRFRRSLFEHHVMLLGPSGSGKELIADAIDAGTVRVGTDGDERVAVSVAAISKSLFASELFGHKRGSFTGAVRNRRGLFLVANGRTLFLDEVGELDPEQQAVLLRVIEEQKVFQVGDDTPTPFSARIVSATRRDIRAMIEKDVSDGGFRLDLYWRLAGCVIELPPLSSMMDDIPQIVDQILAQEGADLRSTEAWERRVEPWILQESWRDHHWPGNVRELRRKVRSLLHDTDFETEQTGSRPTPVPERVIPTDVLSFDATEEGLLSWYRREAITRAEGNLSLAARRLGISKSTLTRHLRRGSHG